MCAGKLTEQILCIHFIQHCGFRLVLVHCFSCLQILHKFKLCGKWIVSVPYKTYHFKSLKILPCQFFRNLFLLLQYCKLYHFNCCKFYHSSTLQILLTKLSTPQIHGWCGSSACRARDSWYRGPGFDPLLVGSVSV